MQRFVGALFVIMLQAGLAAAQTGGQPAATQNSETIQIGLSTDTISITPYFSGADLTIFGSVDNVNPESARQNRYDVIVVLEGPSRPILVQRKDRIMGIWVNSKSLAFDDVPVSYSFATTRPPQDIAGLAAFKQLSLGPDNIFLAPQNPDASDAYIAEFTAALRERKAATDLYTQRVGGVQFLSQSLFRATVFLPANAPIGTHKARAYLFLNGKFAGETTSPLHIAKSGFEQGIYRFAQDYSLVYGIGAVALALLTGWLGRKLLQRD